MTLSNALLASYRCFTFTDPAPEPEPCKGGARTRMPLGCSNFDWVEAARSFGALSSVRRMQWVHRARPFHLAPLVYGPGIVNTFNIKVPLVPLVR